MSYLSGAYFEVFLAGPGAVLTGRFTSVSGLGMELEYEVYNEGGLNYPRYFSRRSSPRCSPCRRGL